MRFRYSTILQVDASGGTFHAYAVVHCGWGMGGCRDTGKITYYASLDGGATWLETPYIPENLNQKLAAAAVRMVQECDEANVRCSRVNGLGQIFWSGEGVSWTESDLPTGIDQRWSEMYYECLDYDPLCSLADPQQCFRLNREGAIESSADGGANWRTDWQFPTGRQEFLRRSYDFILPGVPVDLRAYDLAVLDTLGGVRVVAAMGNQGVIARDEQGNWQRLAVGEAAPAALQSSDLGLIQVDVFRSGVLACLIFIWLNLAAYLALPVYAKQRLWTRNVIWVLVYSLVVSVLLVVLLTQFDTLYTLLRYFCFFYWVTLGLVILVTRKVMLSCNSSPLWARAVNRMSLFYPPILFIVLLLPYGLWALGGIVALQTADWIALGLGVAAAGLCLRHALQSVRWVAQGI